MTESSPHPHKSSETEKLLRKIEWRLIPFLVICYCASYLDRVNLSFAARDMTHDLVFSPEVYGWGAGIFFLGYALLEPPSNYMLHLLGARVWIARIMLSWGLVSGVMAFTWSETSFFVLRFLLGAAEAGFMPGIILYLTYWIPAQQRARLLAAFLFAVPLATVIGAPVSSAIIEMTEGLMGFRGWQWLFICEAAPPILLGIAAFFFLTDRPHQAHWLEHCEITQLQRLLSAEQQEGHQVSFFNALINWPAITLGFAYFGIVLALYGLTMWLPQMIESYGVSQRYAGFLTATPFAVGAAAMFVWSRHSDWRQERHWHTIFASILAMAGLLGAAFSTTLPLSLLFLCMAASGIFSVLPPFWAHSSAAFSSNMAPVAIALVNAIGNLAGFAGPYLVGFIKQAGGSYATALIALAFGPFLCALLMLLIKSRQAAADES